MVNWFIYWIDPDTGKKYRKKDIDKTIMKTILSQMAEGKGGSSFIKNKKQIDRLVRLGYKLQAAPVWVMLDVNMWAYYYYGFRARKPRHKCSMSGDYLY